MGAGAGAGADVLMETDTGTGVGAVAVALGQRGPRTAHAAPECRQRAAAALAEHSVKNLAMRALRCCFREDQGLRAGYGEAATRALALVQLLSPCLPTPASPAPLPMNEDWKRTGLSYAIDCTEYS